MVPLEPGLRQDGLVADLADLIAVEQRLETLLVAQACAARTVTGACGGFCPQVATPVACLVLADDFGAEPATLGYLQAVGLRPGAGRGIVLAIRASGHTTSAPRRYNRPAPMYGASAFLSLARFLGATSIS